MNAKYVWMVVDSEFKRLDGSVHKNPCDIRRYAFSHREAVAQLKHTKGKFKDCAGKGIWTLFKLVKVNKRKA